MGAIEDATLTKGYATGEGVKKPEFKEISKCNRLRNVMFLPYQPRNLF
jgi:hypothetical protein